MKSLGVAALLTLAAINPVTAQNTENFQLLVPFEAGVKLKFFGFNKDKEQVFSEKSPKKITYDDKEYWLALIEEDKVFGGEFQYFCVRDRRNKWSIPEEMGKKAGDLVCDFNPKDTGRGTFIFTPD